MLVRKAQGNISQNWFLQLKKFLKKDFSIIYLHETVNEYKWIWGADR